MALKPCKECKKEISGDADPCPHCGKKSPHGPGMLVKIGGGFLALCFGLVALAAAGGGGKGAQAPTVSAAAVPSGNDAPAPAGPAMEVGALQLQKAYDANEVSADGQYKGKALLVSGRVQAIEKGPFGTIIVKLRAGNPYMGVHARMEDDQAGAAGALKKGAPVRVACTGGGMTIGSPQLRDCRFVE